MSLSNAPPGAPAADCAVCGLYTYLRLVDGEGHIPLCSSECERAWPRVRALLEVAEAARDIRLDYSFDLAYVRGIARLREALAAFDAQEKP